MGRDYTDTNMTHYYCPETGVVIEEVQLTPREIFADTLASHYEQLFNTPSFEYVAKRSTPRQLANLMTDGLANKSANLDGEGIKRTCKQLGIRQTYKAIRGYFATA